MERVELIPPDGKTLACIIRREFCPEKTTFLTPSEYKQQVGYIVYPKGGEAKRHLHKPLQRHIVGTSEVLLIKQGFCDVDIYDNEKKWIATRELRQGDV